MASEIPRTKDVNMPDDIRVRTAVISTEDELGLHLPQFISGIRNKGWGFLVGFDTEWMLRNDILSEPSTCAKVALLKLCNSSEFCLLINLHRFSVMPRSLINLLAIGDITFVGVDIRKQLNKLKEDYGLEIRSTVELTSITAGKTCLNLQAIGNLLDKTCGVKPKGVDKELMSWLLDSPWQKFGEDCTEKQLQYAVFSAYAAIKIAHRLCFGYPSARLMLRPR